jgi:hypothetical protein
VPEIDAGVEPQPLRGGGYSTALFPGGYCTNGSIGSGMSSCDPAADTCGACSSCRALSGGSDPVYACLEDCAVSVFDNGGCRPGYQCDPVSASCQTGCSSDADCNRVRLDGGSVTTIAGGPGTCNMATARCQHPGAAGSNTGDACVNDFDCPSNQQCIFGTGPAGASMGWPGGYCSHAECEVVGFECPSDAVCSGRDPELLLDEPRCLVPCTFMGEAATAALFQGSAGHGIECRTGYSCVWNGTGLVGTPGSGTCQPGNYNGVTTANWGASCTNDSQCYSPFGMGRCFGEPGRPHFCTWLDCTIGLTAGPICDAAVTAVCAPISADGAIEGCVKRCTSATECNAGQGCVVGGGGRICVNFCRSALDCRSGQTCSIPAGETTGSCI